MEMERLSLLAFQGEALPKNLGSFEQAFYLGLRSLYGDFQRGLFTKEQAVKEKKLLQRRYQQAKENEQEQLKLFRYVDSMRIRLAQARPLLQKCHCEACQAVIDILDGRQKSSEGENTRQKPA